MVINEPYKEYEATGTIIFLVQWNGDCLEAERVRIIGNPHPEHHTATHSLHKYFKSDQFEIIGNKHQGFDVDNYCEQHLQNK